jgi:potassium-transporting ATPase KdpC subunit
MNMIFPCFRLFLVLVFLTGVAYPLLVTGLAQLFFHHQAEGSVVMVNGHAVGSELLSQKTEAARYFWPRPSADDYATVASGASNLGPGSDALKKAIADRAAMLRSTYGLTSNAPLPDDAVTTSGSGLDPHISPASARMQVDRVAQTRKFSAKQKNELTELVERHIESPQFGFLGEPRVNVLLLNLAVDQLK